ncbi:MAG: nucleotide sugar dehydrogenase [Kiloniellales bacterium]|nr:nucleotide sugar dehydrogenase [Kiloniellales bacterium]
MSDKERIAVIGLGYVGLPLAVALAERFDDVVGFDIDLNRVEALQEGLDWTMEVSSETLLDSRLRVSGEEASLEGRTFYAITVPTPVDKQRRPDLSFVEAACRTIGKHLAKGAVVVLESTVYPGVTEDFCGSILSEISGLRQGIDFKLGYSPERINPGDRDHSIDKVTKVIAGEDAETLSRLAAIYGEITSAGLFQAASIKAAEMSKVIENSQRDLNIAFMNELAIIADRLGVATRDILDAASTKWNFLPFKPGLVGGHCIGVDPYYLTAWAEENGYHPEVILAGRRTNDGMGSFIAAKLLRLMARLGKSDPQARIGISGLAFKENIPDVRNSRIPDVYRELCEMGFKPMVSDPLVAPEAAKKICDIELTPLEDFRDFDALILAVPHKISLEELSPSLIERVRSDGVVIDVKSVLDRASLPKGLTYWSL